MFVTTLHHEARICLLRQSLPHKNLPNVAFGFVRTLASWSQRFGLVNRLSC